MSLKYASRYRDLNTYWRCKREWHKRMNDNTRELASNTYTRWTPDEIEFAVSHNADGSMTITEIAIQLGRTHQAVATMLHRVRSKEDNN